MSENIHAEITQRFNDARSILIVSHVRPDGDAIGSLLGLGLALEMAQKQVQMVLTDGVPVAFKKLPGTEKVRKQPEGNFDLIVTVDCSDLLRVGKALNGLPGPDINIDHHITNLNFAELNLVEPDAVATAAILTKHLPRWGLTITPDVAAALLAGIVSDTLGFRTSNMTPEALRLAADLMEIGADLPELYSEALIRRSFQAAKYWGAGLSRLQRKDRFIWTSLTLEDRHASDYPGNDDADLVNILSAIYDSDIAVIFIEQKNGYVKVSWRAQPGFDVSEIALKFGGGGHPAAAGADIPGSLGEIESRVLEATMNMFANGQQSSGK